MEALKAEGLVIMPQADYQTEKDTIFRQNATQIESALSEAATKLGIERPANTPVSTWAKMFADAAAAKLVTPPQTTTTPPKEELKGDAMLLAQLNELKNETATLKTLFAQKEKQANEKIIESSVVSELSVVKLGEKPEEQKAKLDALSSLIKTNHNPKVNEKGETVYHGPDGLPLVHADGRLKTALDLTKEKYSFMLLPEAPKVTGLGLTEGVAILADHVIANNLNAINAEAQKKGLVAGSVGFKEFTEKSIKASMAKYGTDFKV